MTTEERVSRLEGAYEQISDRLNEYGQSLTGFRSEVNGRFNKVYVLLGASWVTLMGAIIGLYFKNP